MHTDRPRILLVALNFHPEEISTGKYSTELALHLASNGFDVRVIAAPPYYPEWRVRDTHRWWRYALDWVENVRVRRCPLWVPKRVSGATRILHLSSFALSTGPALLAQVRWRPTWLFLVAPTIATAPAVLGLAALTGARTWLHIQDFELDAAFGLNMLGGTAHRLGRAIERTLLRRFDRVSTISERMRDRLLTAGVPVAKTTVLPNWVDTDEIRPLDDPGSARAEFGLGSDDVVALYSGNMGRKQGLDILVEAARSMRAMPQVTFVLCGEGVVRPRLERACQGQPNVRFLPLQPRGRLNALLNAADIHLLPQEAGAADTVMPSKLTGMLASGRPVVATAAEGTELARVAGRAGVVVAPGDPAAFVKAIKRLAADPAERRELGAHGRAWAVSHLSRHVILAQLTAELNRDRA